MFGVNAELLIDHAWGFEPTTMDLIKAYKPETNSISSGQVLKYPYSFEKGRLIVQEMTDLLALKLVDKRLVTDQMVLTVGYDIDNLSDPSIRTAYKGEVTTDRYGRKVPKYAHGTVHLDRQTSSSRIITGAVLDLYDRIVHPKLLIRRVTIAACRLMDEAKCQKRETFEQLDLFTDYAALEQEKKQEEQQLARERKLQEALLSVKKKYGKNAILKGSSLQEGSTARERNRQIGGHKA